MTETTRRSIAVFWDFENARPLIDTNIPVISNRIRQLLLPHGSITQRNIYYDSQAQSELKTKRVDLDMTGWTLVDCPKRQKKETLDKKLIVDMMFYALLQKNQTNVCTSNGCPCVCLVSGDGDFCYALNRLRDIGVDTIVIYPEKITYLPLVSNASFSYSWDKHILKKEALNKQIVASKVSRKRANSCDEAVDDTSVVSEKEKTCDVPYQIPDDDDEFIGCYDAEMSGSVMHMTPQVVQITEVPPTGHRKRSSSFEKTTDDQTEAIALCVFLYATQTAIQRSKDSRALDALIADIWYKEMNSGESTVTAEKKEWYKSTRKNAITLQYIEMTEVKDVPNGHTTKYATLTSNGEKYMKSQQKFV